jgi:hypothetical protein
VRPSASSATAWSSRALVRDVEQRRLVDRDALGVARPSAVEAITRAAWTDRAADAVAGIKAAAVPENGPLPSRGTGSRRT